GAAWAVHRKACRPAGGHVARELEQGSPAAARGRASGGAVPEPLDDAADPLAVEILARDDDNAAPAEEVGGGKNSSVPERHNGLAAARGNRVEPLEPFRPPAKRGAKQSDRAMAEHGQQLRFEALQPRFTPGIHM